MANDDHDNARTDREMHIRLQGTIDLHTWPHTAVIDMNRAAVEAFVAELQACLAITAPSVMFRIEFKHVRGGGTSMIISSDDLPVQVDGTAARPS